jgi:transcriptional regulator with XRE-family HTH domain
MENAETLRASLHLSQKEFADLIGCKKINIGHWDSHKRGLPSKLISPFLYLTDLLNHALTQHGEVQDAFDYIDKAYFAKILRKKKNILFNLENNATKLNAKIKGHKRRLLIENSSIRKTDGDTLELAITLMGRNADDVLPILEQLMLAKEMRIAALKAEIVYLENFTFNRM